QTFLGGRDHTDLELRDLTRTYRVLFDCPAPRLHRHRLEELCPDKAVKIFPISLQGDLNFGIISSFREAIVIDQILALQVLTKTISWTILTRVGGIYTKPSASEASITGVKSTTSMRESSLTYTTTEITIMSTTEITTMSWLILT